MSQGYHLRMLRSIKYEVLSLSGYYLNKSLSFGFYSCKDCKFCTKTLIFPYVLDNNNYRYRITSHINCKSKNSIIMIYCKHCGPIFISYSYDSIYTFINNLIQEMNINLNHPLSIHFSFQAHSLEDFYFQGIQIFNNKKPFSLIVKWIYRLQTYKYPGINQRQFYPQEFYLNIPFGVNINYNLLNNEINNRFKVSFKTVNSSFNNFKSILCKSKI